MSSETCLDYGKETEKIIDLIFKVALYSISRLCINKVHIKLNDISNDIINAQYFLDFGDL
jgi:hypothetical protein